MSRRKWVSASGEEIEPRELDAEELERIGEEEIVVLLSGFNNFGDKIYNYIKLKFKYYEQLKESIRKGGRFDIREYGEVVAAGKDMPTPEVRAEIESQYKMVAFPKKED